MKYVFQLCAFASLCLASNAPSAANGTATANLNVSATVINNCIVSTSALAFGNYDPVAAQAATALNGMGSLSVTCTNGTPATITLGQGAHPDNGSTDHSPLRRMKASSGNNAYLNYMIYTDTARTSIWGNTAATGAGYNGTGVSTNVNVYGSIGAGQNVHAGTYNDTVLVTVAF